MIHQLGKYRHLGISQQLIGRRAEQVRLTGGVRFDADRRAAATNTVVPEEILTASEQKAWSHAGRARFDC